MLALLNLTELYLLPNWNRKKTCIKEAIVCEVVEEYLWQCEKSEKTFIRHVQDFLKVQMSAITIYNKVKGQCFQ